MACTRERSACSRTWATSGERRRPRRAWRRARGGAGTRRWRGSDTRRRAPSTVRSRTAAARRACSSASADLSAEASDTVSAEAHYREALAIRHRLGDRTGTAGALERLAGNAEEDPERSARLIGAAMALRESIGAPLSAAARSELDRFVAGLAQRIGDGAVATALDAGRGMRLDEAVAFALG